MNDASPMPAKKFIGPLALAPRLGVYGMLLASARVGDEDGLALPNILLLLLIF